MRYAMRRLAALDSRLLNTLVAHVQPDLASLAGVVGGISRDLSSEASPGILKIAPSARKLAQEKGLALENLVATGPKGILTKQDVMDATPAPIPTPAPPADPVQKEAAVKLPQASFVDIPLTQMRRVIAERLLESKTTIPGIYFTVDCNLTELNELRPSLKSSGAKVSVNDFVTRAVALALRDVPSANAFWNSQEQKPQRWPSVDISFAVSTPGGLITPIVKNADQKSLKAVAQEIRDLAELARTNKLKPEQFMGGTFTISNLGMYGIDQFSAIINPPQSCIMAVAAAKTELGFKEGSQEIESISKMTVSLTADARVFDGDLTHHFLSTFQRYIEHPFSLLV